MSFLKALTFSMFVIGCVAVSSGLFANWTSKVEMSLESVTRDLAAIDEHQIIAYELPSVTLRESKDPFAISSHGLPILPDIGHLPPRDNRPILFAEGPTVGGSQLSDGNKNFKTDKPITMTRRIISALGEGSLGILAGILVTAGSPSRDTRSLAPVVGAIVGGVIGFAFPW
ncbi:MAG: hypothetical protein V4498_03950 [candidate division FCPU426 bacterium]